MVDETGFVTLITKQNAKYGLKACDFSATKKFRVVSSTREVMATPCCDVKGIVLIDYLERGDSITGA